ncbi:unnamed protein product [Owenia fusiformis]|uniref:Uncharacterized protein n=1 Tax=Owenia fusiformis TaxID=6347 RepID=A0A8J1XGQ1_OWEFU|nr:unnamed protein product [Owenia fusiformis]
MINITSLILTLGVVSICYGAYTERVLLISMDGFRYDYLDTISNLTNFGYMKSTGTHAPYINNTFITLTFPTHYSMSTGLYSESNGMVSNYMFDPLDNTSFGMGNVEPKWWDGGEPIWTTVMKQNKTSATFFWPGSDVPIHGVLPKYYFPYNKTIPFDDRIDTAVNWLKEGINFATLYFNEPDKQGHDFGPESNEVIEAVKYMDEIMGKILDKLRQNDLLDSTNIILVSDHGMAYTNRSMNIDLSKYVNISTHIEKIANYGAAMNFIPKAGMEDAVYNILKDAHPKMTAYKKEDIPEEWHYKNHHRILPMLLVCDEGWQVVPDESWIRNVLGMHGWDNNLMSMKPFFIARGPNIKEDFVAEPFKSVDLYPLMTELLGLNPAPNNGTLEIVKSFLKDNPEMTSVTATPQLATTQSSSSKIMTETYSVVFVATTLLLL